MRAQDPALGLRPDAGPDEVRSSGTRTTEDARGGLFRGAGLEDRGEPCESPHKHHTRDVVFGARGKTCGPRGHATLTAGSVLGQGAPWWTWGDLPPEATQPDPQLPRDTLAERVP